MKSENTSQLMCCTLTKYPKNDKNAIIGPEYDLSRKDMRIIIEYLKNIGIWTKENLYRDGFKINDENVLRNIGIESDLSLFEYYLGHWDPSNGSSYNLDLERGPKGNLCIQAKYKSSGSDGYKYCLNKDLAPLFRPKLNFENDEAMPEIKLSPSDVDVILGHKEYARYFEFEFDKCDYFLKVIDPLDYLIRSNEDWWQR